MSASAGDLVATLCDRNEHFRCTEFRHIEAIDPTLRTIVVGCVDPRVDPAHVLGLANGEAVIIRNVGGRITPQLFETLMMLRLVVETDSSRRPGPGWNLIVLHHIDCGIARLSGHPEALARYFGVSSDQLRSIPILDARAAVAFDVEALRTNPFLPPEFVLTGLVYDVATGIADIVVPPAIARQ